MINSPQTFKELTPITQTFQENERGKPLTVWKTDFTTKQQTSINIQGLQGDWSVSRALLPADLHGRGLREETDTENAVSKLLVRSISFELFCATAV